MKVKHLMIVIVMIDL